MRIVTLAALLCSVPVVAAAALSLDGKPKAQFKASATAGLTFYGKVKQMAVAESGGNVVFTVAASDIDTGIKLRNSHMRGYLDAENHPNITLSVPKAGVTLPDETKKSTKGEVTAKFTARGVTKDETVTYEITRKRSGGYKVEASFDVDVRDHGIAIPSYLGVTVDPVMPVEAKLEVKE